MLLLLFLTGAKATPGTKVDGADIIGYKGSPLLSLSYVHSDRLTGEKTPLVVYHCQFHLLYAVY